MLENIHECNNPRI